MYSSSSGIYENRMHYVYMDTTLEIIHQCHKMCIIPKNKYPDDDFDLSGIF